MGMTPLIATPIGVNLITPFADIQFKNHKLRVSHQKISHSNFPFCLPKRVYNNCLAIRNRLNNKPVVVNSIIMVVH